MARSCFPLSLRESWAKYRHNTLVCTVHVWDMLSSHCYWHEVCNCRNETLYLLRRSTGSVPYLLIRQFVICQQSSASAASASRRCSFASSSRTKPVFAWTCAIFCQHLQSRIAKQNYPNASRWPSRSSSLLHEQSSKLRAAINLVKLSMSQLSFTCGVSCGFAL